MSNSIYSSIDVKMPDRASWTDTDDIAAVIDSLKDHGQWRYFHVLGWSELHYCRKSHEAGCIEMGESTTVLMPRELKMQRVGDERIPVFKLTNRPLKPILRATDFWPTEEVTELSPGNYADEMCYDLREYKGNPLPPTARPLFRAIRRHRILIIPMILDAHPYRKYNDSVDDYSFADFIATIEQMML